jgi:alpha-beta hydrolase superfamily lysophospholipase
MNGQTRMPRISRKKATLAAAAAVVLAWIGGSFVRGEFAAAGANGLLHPARRTVGSTVPAGYESVTFVGSDVTLTGWRVRARTVPRRGTLVYLHGVADNRGSSATAVDRFAGRGFDVVAYDSRAHGDSGGAVCTYGFHEKQDLARVIDRVEAGPVVVMGTSLGAAVALQAAAEDSRIAAVVAAESFSDLKTVASERAPWFFDATVVSRALALAEERGRFRLEDVSPVSVAPRIRVPVFIIHGVDDVETAPAHARRIYDALGEGRRLRLVEGAGHNRSLTPAVWSEIENWIDAVLRGA